MNESVNKYLADAENGNAEAQRNLGLCYENGDGIKQNYTKAVEWYKKAAEQNDAIAQFYLGNCYFNGRGEAKDLSQEKIAYYDGYNCSLKQNGIDLYHDYGVAKDYSEAVKWYSKSAQNGYVLSQVSLAYAQVVGLL